MNVEVVRDGVHYFCKSEEQLKLFLSAGYVEVKEDKKPDVKKAKEKK